MVKRRRRYVVSDYSRFWKEYDSFSRYANRTMETTLNLDLSTASLLDLSVPKEMSGQLLLPDTIEYVLPFSRRTPRTSSFRLMRPIGPMDDPSTFIHRITRPRGYWSLTTDVDTVRSRLLSIMRTWLENSYPGRYEITETKEYTHRRTVLEDLRTPTDEELEHHALRRTGYTLTIRIEYDYYASSMGGPREHTWTEEFGSVTEIYEATEY